MNPASSHSGVARIALSSVFTGAMAVLARTLAGKVPFAEIVTIRFAVGIVCCALLFAIRRQRPRFTAPRVLVLRGLFGGIAVLAYFLCIETLGAAPATVLNYCAPIFAALWATVFLHERSSSLMRVGLVCATAGAVLVTISTGAIDNPLHPAIGALAGLAAAVFGGAGMTAVKAARAGADALTVFFVFCLMGLLLALPLGAANWVPLTRETLPVTLAVGVLAMCGQMFFTSGMGHTSALVGSATTQLVPVVTWGFSIAFLADPVSPLALAGAALCVGGVLVGVLPGPTGPDVGRGKI